jgi:DNA mismatch repair ATPase MutS
MGARLLRTNILQPSIKREKIEERLGAVSELSTNEEAFIAIKRGERYYQ